MSNNFADMLHKLRNDATPLKDVAYQSHPNALSFVVYHYIVIIPRPPIDRKTSLPPNLKINGKAITEESTVAELLKALEV